MMGDQPGEGKGRGQTSRHTQSQNLYLSIPLHLRKKKKSLVVEQLQFLCHPSLNWLLLWLSKWPPSNLHIAFSFSIQLLVMCVKPHSMLLECAMYCYWLLYDWALSSEAGAGWQIKYLTMLHLEILSQSSRGMGMCVSVCVCDAEKACDRLWMLARQ